MDPRKISIADFTYSLPDNRIALYPKAGRDSSRLLVYQHATIEADLFSNISERLPAHSMIVFNNTRVIEARLLFEKPTGARIEVFCLRPNNASGNMRAALGEKNNSEWICLIGNASAWTPGLVLEKKNTALTLRATVISAMEGQFLVSFSWEPCTLSFEEVLHAMGAIPLPPYIKRKAEPTDATRYQTVFADAPGSVAAPTAGLHFTPDTLRQLAAKNIRQEYLTLHVGAGTFQPVKAETMNGHAMHEESIEINLSLLESLLQHLPLPVTAVGTTTLRTLESLYWLGRKIILQPNISEAEWNVEQWDPYNNTSNIPAAAAIGALLHRMRTTGTEQLVFKTRLLIAPGYIFRIVNILVTNFHQPGSTLLLLVAAFIGENWKSVYTYALENDFRFLSYGDACLLFRQEQPPLPQEVQA